MAKKQQMREYLYLDNLHGGGGGEECYHGNYQCDEEFRKGRSGVLCLAVVKEGLPEEETLKLKLHLRNTNVGILKLSLKDEVRVCACTCVREWGDEVVKTEQ